MNQRRHPALCLAPAERARFQHLQALEDAIAYRTARLAAACPECGPERCDDHATDTWLIAAYRQAAALAAQPVERRGRGRGAPCGEPDALDLLV